MPDGKFPDWRVFYGVADIPLRAWLSPDTFKQMRAIERNKITVAEVKAEVKSRAWFNLFLIGVGMGLIVIASAIIQRL